MNYEKCLNCGADYELHKFDTNQCPLHGIEETRENHKQEWANTKFVVIPAKPDRKDFIRYNNKMNWKIYALSLENHIQRLEFTVKSI